MVDWAGPLAPLLVSALTGVAGYAGGKLRELRRKTAERERAAD